MTQALENLNILNDDFGQGTHEDVVNLLNKLTKNSLFQTTASRSLTVCRDITKHGQKRLN